MTQKSSKIPNFDAVYIRMRMAAIHEDRNMVQPMYYSPVHTRQKQMKTMYYSLINISLTTCLGMLVSYCKVKFLLGSAILKSSKRFIYYFFYRLQ